MGSRFRRTAAGSVRDRFRDSRTVRAYDIEKDGAPGNERVLISGIEGVPDGIRVDEKGNIYVAAKEVYIYNSAGKRISQINMGETPSNLGWGDSDFGTLLCFRAVDGVSHPAGNQGLGAILGAIRSIRFLAWGRLIIDGIAHPAG